MVTAMWDPTQHSDQDNLTWSYFRAVEWGRWPVFMSQVYAPPMLLFLNWKILIATVVIVNILWAVFIRYRHVDVGAASAGALLVRLKWMVCPGMGIYFYFKGQVANALIAVLWPLLIFIIGFIPTVQVGKIQKRFMAKLGYEYSNPFDQQGVSP